MTDCEMVRLEVDIPLATYEALALLTDRQNAELANNVSRILNDGIAATYERWPNLKTDVR